MPNCQMMTKYENFNKTRKEFYDVLFSLDFIKILSCIFLKIFLQLTCEICYEVYPRNSLHATSCGHPFCSSCWKGMISTRKS